MNKDFVKILGQRIRKNSIKKFAPMGNLKINIYYNTSRYKIELETFVFESEVLRDEKLNYLDLNFGIEND